MPELPEVETVRRGLVPVIQGQRIEHVQVNRPDLRWPFPKGMAKRLSQQTITLLRRRSKYLLADLSGGETFLIHLGMSGRVLISGEHLGTFVTNHPRKQNHDHVVLDFSNGARLTYNDPRRFGAMDIFETVKESQNKHLHHLGPEPLSNEFNALYFTNVAKSRKSSIKNVLLDQRIVAGLGNIYVCESLYRTGISPKKKACDISRERLGKLVPNIRTVLEKAITAGGSSLRDFRHADGELGYFQHSFAVYGREGKPCPTPDCDSDIARMVQSGRSSFYCPKCQK
ncbi:bifunctional DNA-formamidopyrimidine glycosylase/DNA-(apurinic or apyrimidinic site) lyase [Paracoccaceae bacterium]|nr:bifunctional DNA-formamidopyrimidine glycosylase/DNA-(apurinic or apyrimidinic site) lyase [Paracoccaceae bacterium]